MAATREKVGVRTRVRQIGIAFTFTRNHDRFIVPILLTAFLTPLVVTVLAALLTSQWLLIPLGVMVSVLLVLIVFSRRMQKATYAEVEGKPGAAAAVLQNVRGGWRVTPAIALTPQQDVLHRVVGRAGVILISEGVPHRLRNLVAQEKKKISRVAPEVAVHDLVVGDAEGEVPLRKLPTRLLKLPRTITPKQADAVEQRLQALGGTRPPVPKGPMPRSARAAKGAKQQMYRGR